MTPGEIKGLQSLALAHGGSLTINPETGLPEASFLKWLIPALAVAFAPFTGGMSLGAEAAVAGGTLAAEGATAATMASGLLTPLATATTALASPLYAGGAGLATALGEGIMEKDLGKGLMAGMSAFGGLSTLGTLGTAAGLATAPEVAHMGAGTAGDIAARAAENEAIYGVGNAVPQLPPAINPAATLTNGTYSIPGTYTPRGLLDQTYLPEELAKIHNAPVPTRFDDFASNIGKMSTWDKAKLAGGVA